MGKLYMGFDAGTQSVKVAVYDEQFRLVTITAHITHLSAAGVGGNGRQHLS